MLHNTALAEPQSRSKDLQNRLAKYLGKIPAAALIHVARMLRNLSHRCQRGIRFDLVTWAPRGRIATYLGYYPDSLLPSDHLNDLYRRWIRGNKTNNNGDASRFIALALNLRQLQTEGIDGDFAELGVWKGNSAALLADFAVKSGKRLFLFDTFSGFDRRDLVGVDRDRMPQFADTSIEYVQETVGHSDLTMYVQGLFPESLTDELRERTFALAHIDCDLYEPMKAALEFFYSRMPKGGMLILHDYSVGCWAGATNAIDEFCKATGEFVSLWPDKSGTAMIRKSREISAALSPPFAR